MIYELDVALTDFLLFIECVIFATLFYKQKTAQTVLRRLLIVLFSSLAASSLLGAFFHAFFPAKAEEFGGFIMWIAIATAIAVTSATLWCISALVSRGQKFLRIILPFAAFYLVAFIATIVFVNYQFITIILFYAPPMAVLGVIALIKAVSNRSRQWAILFGGIALSFVAAAVQALHISIHPVYFNYNSLYHLIQAVSLGVIFAAFRSLLKK